MSETAAPMQDSLRALNRYTGLMRLHAEAHRIELQIRQETAALVDEDTPFALRSFVADELSLGLSESKGTCQRQIDHARMLLAHPQVVARLGESIEDVLTGRELIGGMFGIRHADAILDELAGASEEVQREVLDLVLGDPSARTPFQLRKATRAARLLHDLDADQDKQDRIHDNRGVDAHDEIDGSGSIVIGGRKSGCAALLAAIDAHVAVAEPGDTRSLRQRRYDWLMDLVCGRTEVTEQWQALIVVGLDTLEGGDAPAEIPGLGLVSAEEAREILANATFRRAVVSSRGELVGLDDEVLHGDRLEQDADRAKRAAARREQRLLALCSVGITSIESYLDARSLASVTTDRSTSTTHHGDTDGAARSDDRPDEGPPDDDPEPPTSGGQGPPRPRPSRPGGDGEGNHAGPPTHVGEHGPDEHGPDEHDEHDEHEEDEQPSPTWAEREWLDLQEDRAGTHDRIDARAHRTNGCTDRQDRIQPVAPSLQRQQWREERLRRRTSSNCWTTAGLRAAVTHVRTAPPTPVPAASQGYPFRGRLARWIKTRDITCTFPGCDLLAQRCQLDHVVAYPMGATEHANGACECVHHHQAKHACIDVVRLTDGTMRWTTRFGVTVDRPPRPLLRGW